MVSPGNQSPPKRRAGKVGASNRAKPAGSTIRKKSNPATEVTAVAITVDLPAGSISVTSTERQAKIERAAYFRSQRRGFVPGFEMEDWLAAEAEVDQRLAGDSP
jgi:hypothetical protein